MEDAHTASAQNRKEVLAASKLAQAKAARYKIFSQNRRTLVDGSVNVVDIHRDEQEEDLHDEITCNLLPMVREYLTVSGQAKPETLSKLDQESKELEEVYDLYYHDEGSRVSTALKADRVATLEVNSDEFQSMFIDHAEDETDSEHDSDDSNGMSRNCFTL
eukprot:jgi/Hompol1/3047/HPOL_006311-RA